MKVIKKKKKSNIVITLFKKMYQRSQIPRFHRMDLEKILLKSEAFYINVIQYKINEMIYKSKSLK